MKFEYTVLENGFDFILESIKNLSGIDEKASDSTTNKRLIKYSLLHLSSGIELVFKYKLFQANWAYVFKDMDRAKKANLQSGDFISVGSESIVKRLENLCDIKLTKSDTDSLRILRKERNKAEHFNLNGDILKLKKLIHNCITVLIGIINENYDSDDFSGEEREMFSKIKSSLHQSEQHYNDALAIAQKELKQSGMESEVLICPQCEEEFLLIQEGEANCSSCGYKAQGERAARDYISNILGINSLETIAKVGYFPLYDCPDCNDFSLVLDEAEGNMAICFSCGFCESDAYLLSCSDCEKQFICIQYAGDETASCPECGEEIPFDDSV